MFKFGRRSSNFSTIFDQYESDSTKKVFEDEEDKSRIRKLLWSNIHAGITYKKASSVRYMYYGAAAAIVLVFFTGYLFVANQANRKINLQWTKFENTSNSIKKVWLPDSSCVWVQQYGSVAWRSDFNNANRLVVLQKGECFFEVRKQSGRPFVVVTDSIQTKVLGTSFLVRKDNISNQVSVSVLTGKVQVSRNDSLIRLLYPRDQVTVDQRTAVSAYKTIDASDLILWKQGKIILREAHLTTIANYLSQHYNISIKLDPGLLHHSDKYNFIFSSASTADEAINILKDISPSVVYRKTDEKNWVWFYGL